MPNTETAKKIINWNGVEVGLSTLKGEKRFRLAPPMQCDYGHLRGTWGAALDKKSLDVYVVSDSPNVHKVYQLNPTNRKLDEHKYILGADSIDHAKQVYLKHLSPAHFGGIIQYDIERMKEDGKLNK